MTKARSNATANAAKGDLTVGTGTNLSGVLSAGNNGEALVLDSSTSTGLRYTAGTVQGNPTLNSAFQVWQRGTSFAVNAQTYTADRWVGYRGATGMTVSRQLTNDTTNLPNIQYCARVQRDSGNATTGALQFGQMFESVNAIPYAGKTVTYSFYARAGANYSSASGMTSYLITGTGTDQNYFTSYTGSAFNGVGTTLTTTWQRFQGTFTLASTATEFALLFAYTPTGTAGANDYFEVTGVQVDIGSVALPFRTYAGTIQGELAACQRYYYRATAGDVYTCFANGHATGTTTAALTFYPKITMRTTPSSLDYSTLLVGDGISSQSVTLLALNAQTISSNSLLITATVGTGLTQFRPYYLIANNSSSAYVGLSAEL